jgi:DUF4097 and DUF4098 domain-containing protein YvlB
MIKDGKTKGPFPMKTKRMPKALFPLALAAIVVLGGCVFNVDRITQQKTGQIESAGLTKATIDLSDHSGNITVSGTSDSIVKATATASEMAIAGEGGSALDELSVSVTAAGNVAFSYPSGSDKWELIRIEGMTVTCFDGLDVSAKTTSGNIDLTGINGALTLETTSGNITATVVSECNVTVTSGNIDITLKPDSSFSAATLKTTSGNIKIMVPAGFKADLELKTTSGNIHTPGDDHSHLNGGNAAAVISCTATSGNIRIEEVQP